MIPSADQSQRVAVSAVIAMVVLIAHSVFIGAALRLPGELGGFLEVLLLIGLVLYFAGATVYLLIVGFTKPRVTRRWWRSYSMQGLALAGLFVVRYFLLPDPYFVGVRLKHMGLEEKHFMDFAKRARDAFGHFDQREASLNALIMPDMVSEAKEVERARAFETLLSGSVFEQWPQRMLRLSVSNNSVTVWRGSGMMGLVGIQIFDTDSGVVLNAEDVATRGNPYVPRQRALAERVYFIDGN